MTERDVRARRSLRAIGALRSEMGVVGAILAAIALFALADIRVELPINDDWAYYTPVAWLMRTGRLGFTDWQYMTLLTQLALGYGWSLVFGFSLTGLRVLTIVVSLFGFVALVQLNRLMVGRSGIALALALMAYVSPLNLVATASFLTDIYFWALTLGSMSLLYAALARRSPGLELAGWSLALVALLERQLAIAIPIGFLVACLCRDGWRTPSAWRALAPLGLMALMLAVYTKVVTATIGLPADFTSPSRRMAHTLGDLAGLHPGALLPVVRGSATALLYLGLLTIPLGAALFAGRLDRPKRVAAIVAGLAILAVAIVARAPLPTGGNTIGTSGLGPRLLPGIVQPPVGVGWWLLTACAAQSLAVVLTALVAPVRQVVAAPRAFVSRHHRSLGVLTTAILAYLPLIAAYGPWLDRHLILTATLLPPVVVALVGDGAPPPASRLLLALVGLMALAGLALLHDSFAWRRAVEQAVGAVESHGVPSRAIAGGFEQMNYSAQPDDPAAPRPPVHLVDEQRRCVVAERLPAGYVPLAHARVDKWLGLGADWIDGGCRN